MPTLDELRARSSASKNRSRPTRTLRVTLDQALLADVERLENERTELVLAARRAAATDDDGGESRSGPPRKLGQRATPLPPRAAEIDSELAALYDRMRASEGELLIRAGSGAEWQAWKDDHPPREDNQSDARVAAGYCNAADLLNDLGRYVVAWDGEDLADGDWDGWLRDALAPGDLRDLVTAVVGLHEQSGVRAPKSSTDSSATSSGEPG